MSSLSYLVKFRMRTGEYGTVDKFLDQFPRIVFSSGEEKRELVAYLDRVACAVWERAQETKPLYVDAYLEQLIYHHTANVYSTTTCMESLDVEIEVYFLIEFPYIVYYNLMLKAA